MLTIFAKICENPLVKYRIDHNYYTISFIYKKKLAIFFSFKKLGDFWMTSCLKEVESLILLCIIEIPLTVTNFSEQGGGYLAL